MQIKTKNILLLPTAGEMAEWSNAVVLKTIVQKCTGGSNPSLSAKRSGYNQAFFNLVI
tara:strand:- start:163 stop:336 length:174 start_codon:yes stop_codon:yes gene_type:complete